MLKPKWVVFDVMGVIFEVGDDTNWLLVPFIRSKGPWIPDYMAYVEMHASHNTQVGLMSSKGSEPFDEKYGFDCRPNSPVGSGMTIFWKANLAATSGL